jgi:hypothetical protein
MSAAIAILRPPISTAHTPANTLLLHLGPGAAAFAAYVGLNATDLIVLLAFLHSH